MDSAVTIQPPLTLRGFCEGFIAKHSSGWPPHEATLADEFVAFLQLDSLLSVRDPKELCKRLGINVTVRGLPEGLRGHNHAYQGRQEIVLGAVSGQAEAFGVQEHTLFHELRELVEYEFRKLGRPTTTAASDLEARAELFASTVRSMAAMNFLKPAFEDWDTKSRWGKLGLVLLGCGLVITSFAYFLLPHWEDRLAK